MEQSGKRRPGAPLNNTNNLKHGYYARKLPERLSTELENHDFKRLEEEKQIIRFFLSRIIELGAQTQDLDQAISLARVASLSVTTLARIIRTEKMVGYLKDPDAAEHVLEVIREHEQRILATYGIANAFRINHSRVDNNCTELNFIEESPFDHENFDPLESEADNPHGCTPKAPVTSNA